MRRVLRRSDGVGLRSLGGGGGMREVMWSAIESAFCKEVDGLSMLP